VPRLIVCHGSLQLCPDVSLHIRFSLPVSLPLFVVPFSRDNFLVFLQVLKFSERPHPCRLIRSLFRIPLPPFESLRFFAFFPYLEHGTPLSVLFFYSEGVSKREVVRLEPSLPLFDFPLPSFVFGCGESFFACRSFSLFSLAPGEFLFLEVAAHSP